MSNVLQITQDLKIQVQKWDFFNQIIQGNNIWDTRFNC